MSINSQEEIDEQIFKEIATNSSKKEMVFAVYDDSVEEYGRYSNEQYDTSEEETYEGRLAMLAEIPSSSSGSNKYRTAEVQNAPLIRSLPSLEQNEEYRTQAPLLKYSQQTASAEEYEFLEKIKEENETEQRTYSGEYSDFTNSRQQNTMERTLENTKQELDQLNEQIQRNMDDNQTSRRKLAELSQRELLKDDPVQFADLETVWRARHQSELIGASNTKAVSPSKNDLVSFALSNSQADTDLFQSNLRQSDPSSRLGENDQEEDTPPRDYGNTMLQYQWEESNSLKPRTEHSGPQQRHPHLQSINLNNSEVPHDENYQSLVSFQNRQLGLRSPEFSQLTHRSRDRSETAIGGRSKTQSVIVNDVTSRDFLNGSNHLMSFNNLGNAGDYQDQSDQSSLGAQLAQQTQQNRNSRNFSELGQKADQEANRQYVALGGRTYDTDGSGASMFHPRYVEASIESMPTPKADRHEAESQQSEHKFHQTTVMSTEQNQRTFDAIRIVSNGSAGASSQQSSQPEQWPDNRATRAGTPALKQDACEAERRQMYYIIERLRQTQEQFSAHGCSNLLDGDNQSNYIEISQYLNSENDQNNGTVLDLLSQVTEQHTILSVNVIELLAEVERKNSYIDSQQAQMEQREAGFAERYQVNERNFKKQFEDKIATIKANIDSEVAKLKTQSSEETSQLQIKNKHLAEQQKLYQSSLGKCKDIIQAQQTKIDRLTSQNSEAEDQIQALKGDIQRYLDKDGRLTQTLELNSTQLMNLERQVCQAQDQLAEANRQGERYVQEVQALAREKQRLLQEVEAREGITAQNQLLRQLEAMMLGSAASSTGNWKPILRQAQDSTDFLNSSNYQSSQEGPRAKAENQRGSSGIPTDMTRTDDTRSRMDKLNQAQQQRGRKDNTSLLVSGEYNLSPSAVTRSQPRLDGTSPDVILREPELSDAAPLDVDSHSVSIPSLAQRGSRNAPEQHLAVGAATANTFGSTVVLDHRPMDLRMTGNFIGGSQCVTRLEITFLQANPDPHEALTKQIEREVFGIAANRSSDSAGRSGTSASRRCRSSGRTGSANFRGIGSLSKNSKSKAAYLFDSVHRGHNSFTQQQPPPCLEYSPLEHNQDHCDLMARHLSIVGQNEQIIKRFKMKEKEMISNYDKIVVDQDTKLRFLESQRLDVEDAHSQEIHNLRKCLASTTESESGLRKQLAAEAASHIEVTDEFKKQLANNQKQISQLKETIEKLQTSHKVDLEALKTAHSDAMQNAVEENQAQMERAWEEVEVRAELVNQGYMTIESLKAQVVAQDSTIKQKDEELLSRQEEKDAVHSVNLELLHEYEQLLEKLNGTKAEHEKLNSQFQDLARRNKELKKENRQLLRSNDEFQSTIIDELNQLNDTMAKKKKNKDAKKKQGRQQNEMLSLLDNFQRNLMQDDKIEEHPTNKARSCSRSHHEVANSKPARNHQFYKTFNAGAEHMTYDRHHDQENDFSRGNRTAATGEYGAPHLRSTDTTLVLADGGHPAQTQPVFRDGSTDFSGFPDAGLSGVGHDQTLHYQSQHTVQDAPGMVYQHHHRTQDVRSPHCHAGIQIGEQLIGTVDAHGRAGAYEHQGYGSNHHRHNTVNQFQHMNHYNQQPERHPMESQFGRGYHQPRRSDTLTTGNARSLSPRGQGLLNGDPHLQTNIMDLIIDSISQNKMSEERHCRTHHMPSMEGTLVRGLAGCGKGASWRESKPQGSGSRDSRRGRSGSISQDRLVHDGRRLTARVNGGENAPRVFEDDHRQTQSCDDQDGGTAQGQTLATTQTQTTMIQSAQPHIVSTTQTRNPSAQKMLNLRSGSTESAHEEFRKNNKQYIFKSLSEL